MARLTATRPTVVAVALVIMLLAGALASAMLGQLPIKETEVIGSVLDRIGIANSWTPSEQLIEATLWQIRFPRTLMSILVGALLAVSGAAMQAIFANPLAEPGVVGVSSGAAFGASLAIAAGASALGDWSIALAAFVGGLVATTAVYFTARGSGRTEIVTLLLTGIAVNAFCGAGIATSIFLSDTASREQIIFWQLGSLNGTRWPEVFIVAAVGMLGIGITIALGRKYDLLALGERTATHLGVRVEPLRIVTILTVAMLTGVAVAFVGIIGFVGLVVPHIMRMLVGPEHRRLIVFSLLGGGVLLVWADLATRTLVEQADLPIGLLTALVGGPFFFFLVHRARRDSGGWV